MTLTLKTANQLFCVTFCIMMVHQHTKLGTKG